MAQRKRQRRARAPKERQSRQGCSSPATRVEGCKAPLTAVNYDDGLDQLALTAEHNETADAADEAAGRGR